MSAREGGREPQARQPSRGAKRARPDNDAEAGDRSAANDKAAQLLALRPHFRRELEVKLQRTGYEPAEIAEALDKLVRLRLLDDAALARSFVDTVARRKGWGRMRVAQELARRGAPEDAAQAALAGLAADADLEGARAAARKWRGRRSRSAAGPSAGGNADAAAALARHLSRRGFPSSAIFKVLKEMAAQSPRLSEADDEGGEPAPEE